MNLTKVKKIFKALLVVLGAVSWGVCVAATDPLAEYLKPEVSAMFGESSYFVYALYLGEFITCAFLYIQTKKISTLLSIPVVIIATHFFFKYAGSQLS